MIEKLRERIQIKTRTAARQGTGAEIYSWALTAEVWAELRPVGAAERLDSIANSVVATATHTARIRARNGLLPSMRVYWGDRILEITGIELDPAKRYMTLSLFEVIE